MDQFVYKNVFVELKIYTYDYKNLEIDVNNYINKDYDYSKKS